MSGRRYIPGSTRVAGSANLGDIVVYEDRANPTRAFEVIGLPGVNNRFGTDYLVREIDTTYEMFSDLRQYGWTLAEIRVSPEVAR